jgi:spore coat polysaccharide biosynthesis protein SpsF (cytidylyltransferase family)
MHGKSLLNRVIDRALEIKESDEVWVATSNDTTDDAIEWMCKNREIPCYRGSLENVRSRFFDIAVDRKADVLVRVTADNPFTEPSYADQMIRHIKQNPEVDYARMVKSTIVDGTGSEVFTMSAFRKAVENFTSPSDIEHVTTSLISEFNMTELTPENPEMQVNEPFFLGVDTMEDYIRTIRLYHRYGDQVTLKQIIQKVNQHESIL